MNAATLAALRGLLSDRAENLDEQRTLKAEQQRIEAEIGLLVASEPEAVRVPGFGSVVISRPSAVVAFDPGALRELIGSLRETGAGDLADEIASCTRTSERAGGLRITPERSAQ